MILLIVRRLVTTDAESKQLELLKKGINSLSPTGEKGFEGLMGTALSAVAGVPMRLSGGGSQFGIDGKAMYRWDAICFECKRYGSSNIDRSDVVTKIVDLPHHYPDVDLWILAASTNVMGQHAKDFEKHAAENGVAVLILDWPKEGISPLAVTLAMGGDRVKSFLERNITDENTRKETLEALDVVNTIEGYDDHASRIKKSLHEPSIGLELARSANKNWLDQCFSDVMVARRYLGQPLAPNATACQTKPRAEIIAQINPVYMEAPENKVLAVLGADGNGKSWAVIQSWLSEQNKPLLLFLPAENFTNISPGAIEELLIQELIRQTDDKNGQIAINRWKRRFEAWSNHPTERLRLVVVIDGLNQRSDVNWARIIEALMMDLEKMGARLIITARVNYFREYIANRLATSTRVIKVDIPEWTEGERNELLATYGIDPLKLHPSSSESLKNPRLLGIAIELIKDAQISAVEEITKSRLLFEYMRTLERDVPSAPTAQEFSRNLRDHANEVLSRYTKQQQKDLRIFKDLEIFKEGIEAVQNEAFFQSLRHDPTQYEITDDGLLLALAFEVIDRLCIAERNIERNIERKVESLDGTIETIIEPISALDDTAEIILASLIITSIDHDRYSDEIRASLVFAFANLQNPNSRNFSAFASCCKKCPRSFVTAAKKICLDDRHYPNFDWVEYALIQACDDDALEAWKVVSPEVCNWLSLYSLTSIDKKHSPSQKDADAPKKVKSLDHRLELLSSTEQTFIETLSRSDQDLNRLSELAIDLMAGKELASFAKFIVKWCFSIALNNELHAPYKNLLYLLRFNTRDWEETRNALIKESTIFKGDDVSFIGKWALVNILGSTGNSKDSLEAKKLRETLNEGRDLPISWRRIETFCETDPCDPHSEQPKNISETITKYTDIDISVLACDMSRTIEDHFFEEARFGLARFEPETAVKINKDYIANVILRTGRGLYCGLVNSRTHNALLSKEQAFQLLEHNSEQVDGLDDEDCWTVQQYQLLLSFPLLTAKEQADALAALPDNTDILFDLASVLKPLEKAEYESRLKDAYNSNNEHLQFVLLVQASWTETELSQSACEYILKLSASQSQKIRSNALSVIAASDDANMIETFASSDWCAKSDGDDFCDENLYGSAILLKAIKHDFVSQEVALDRISPRQYGRAASIFDKSGLSQIALRIDAAIDSAAIIKASDIPDIELRTSETESGSQSSVFLTDKHTNPGDIEQVMKHSNEGKKEYSERIKRIRESFREFKRKLSVGNAQIILDNFTLQEFRNIVEANEELASRWFQLIKEAKHSELSVLHNIGSMLAYSLSYHRPKDAELVYRRLKEVKPIVRVTYQVSSIDLESASIWKSADCEELNAMRRSRFDKAQNDAELANEVLSALQGAKNHIVEEYIKQNINSNIPSQIGRALMVAGFSDESDFNTSILNEYENHYGTIGEAHKAALYAYERNIWAKHWYQQMTMATDPSEFWCHAVLFTKIVDGRFYLWKKNCTSQQELINLFAPSFDNSLRSRIKKWDKVRSKKLLGFDAPAPLFLRGIQLSS